MELSFQCSQNYEPLFVKNPSLRAEKDSNNLFIVIVLLVDFRYYPFYLQRWRWSVCSYWYSWWYCACAGLVSFAGFPRWQFSGWSSWESRPTSCGLETNKRWKSLSPNLNLGVKSWIRKINWRPPSHNPCTHNKFCGTLKNPHTVRKEYGA